MEKTISIRNTEITFSIWDLGGQREFVNMLPLVCNDAVAILFMFDLTRKSTLNSIKEWYRQGRGFNKTAIPFLIGTKYDHFVNFPREDQEEISNQVRAMNRMSSARRWSMQKLNQRRSRHGDLQKLCVQALSSAVPATVSMSRRSSRSSSPKPSTSSAQSPKSKMSANLYYCISQLTDTATAADWSLRRTPLTCLTKRRSCFVSSFPSRGWKHLSVIHRTMPEPRSLPSISKKQSIYQTTATAPAPNVIFDPDATILLSCLVPSCRMFFILSRAPTVHWPYPALEHIEQVCFRQTHIIARIAEENFGGNEAGAKCRGRPEDDERVRPVDGRVECKGM